MVAPAKFWTVFWQPALHFQEYIFTLKWNGYFLYYSYFKFFFDILSNSLVLPILKTVIRKLWLSLGHPMVSLVVWNSSKDYFWQFCFPFKRIYLLITCFWGFFLQDNLRAKYNHFLGQGVLCCSDSLALSLDKNYASNTQL